LLQQVNNAPFTITLKDLSVQSLDL
jgi:hypothetical protein